MLRFLHPVGGHHVALVIILGLALVWFSHSPGTFLLFALLIITLLGVLRFLGLGLRMLPFLLLQTALRPFGRLLRLFRYQPPASTLHGSARWASPAETERYHFGGEIYLGLRVDAFGRMRPVTVEAQIPHVLVLGATGLGKTTGVVIPSLLSLTTSCCINDWKSDLFATTAAYRARVLGQRVLRFAPGEVGSAAFNFLETIRIGTSDEIDDSRTLAMVLGEAEPRTGDSAHFIDLAEALIAGTILFCLYERAAAGERPASLGDVARLLSHPNLKPADLYDEMGQSPHLFISSVGQQQLSRADREQSGILSTAQRLLLPWLSPTVVTNTAHSDFALSDLWAPADGRPTSIYLTTRADRAEALAPVMRLFLSVLTMHMQSRTPLETDTHVVLVLDEFAALRRCSAINNSLPRLRSFGCTAMIVVQSLRSLVELYSPNHSIVANCAVKCIIGVGELSDAEYVSRSLGIETRSWISRSVSTSWSRYGIARSRQSGTAWTSRPLQTADEVATSPHVIVWQTGERPLRCHRLRFYEHPVFVARASMAPDDPIPPAANENVFPEQPLPRPVRYAAMVALLLVPLSGYGIFHGFSGAAEPVAAQQAAAEVKTSPMIPTDQSNAYGPLKPPPSPAAPLPPVIVPIRDGGGIVGREQPDEATEAGTGAHLKRAEYGAPGAIPDGLHPAWWWERAPK